MLKNMKTTYNTFKNILTKNFFIKPTKISTKSLLNRDLGISSLEFVDLIVTVENTFQIELNDKDLEAVSTVGELVRCIDRSLANKYPNLYGQVA